MTEITDSIQKGDQPLLRKLAGSYLKSLRENVGLTQWKLAKALGFRNPVRISSYENGKSAFSSMHLEKFCEVTKADYYRVAKMTFFCYQPHAFRALFPDEFMERRRELLETGENR